MRWPAIRGEFQQALAEYLRRDLNETYCSIPVAVSEALAAERKRVEALLKDVREVADWLKQREQAATIASLYGR